MELTITQSYLTKTVKTLKPYSVDIIELSKATNNGIITQLDYSMRQKGFILKHKERICYIKSAKHAQYIHNWYVGTNEDLNINTIVRIQKTGIIEPILNESHETN